ncbi:MAG: DUF1732 domain-containing protein [Pseudomonadota bacterium]
MQSMTGFAAVERTADAAQLRWEAKSVNGRGFDLRIRSPSGWEAEEAAWRALAAKRIARGSVSITLYVEASAEETGPSLNAAALARAAAWTAEAERALAAAGATLRGAAPEALLQIKGVLEHATGGRGGDGPRDLSRGPDPDTAAAARGLLAEALDGLCAARAAEGARQVETLTAILSDIETLTEKASAQADLRGDAQRAKLSARVAALIGADAPVDEERLAQELALIATRLDVAEEIDRLRAHLSAARDLIASDGPVGRKLDFLAQEFNREANTLCAKSQDAALTETGLALKVAIDQLKEQAANVE